jgi:hypothetical protein
MPVFLPVAVAMMAITAMMVMMPVVSAIVLESFFTAMTPSTDEFSQSLRVQLFTRFQVFEHNFSHYCFSLV